MKQFIVRVKEKVLKTKDKSDQHKHSQTNKPQTLFRGEWQLRMKAESYGNRCPTTDEWIKKMWYLCTIEFYSAMKKNEILSFVSKWMVLENIILSEVSQAQKTKNHMFSLICGL
jgi:hypothetical protein